jgi:hypothetical protein
MANGWSYIGFMNHILAVALTAIWIVANFYLWSLKQSHVMLFYQSLGMAAIGFSALWFYVSREPNSN